MRVCYDMTITADLAIVSIAPVRKRLGGPGRKPVFTKEVRKRFLARMRLGDRPTVAARNVGVSDRTVRRYVAKNPGFARKMAEAERPAIEIVEDRMFKLTETSVPAGIFWLSNRAPERWKRDADKALLAAQINVGQGQSSVEWSLQEARAEVFGMIDELEQQRRRNAEKQQAIEADSREADDG